MGCDEHVLGGDLGRVVSGEHSMVMEVVDHGGVVDQIAEDGDGAGGGSGLGVADGVADAEAPTEVGCTLQLHDWLCVTKLTDTARN